MSLISCEHLIHGFFPLLNLCLVPSAGDVERAKALKEEGNDLVKKGNHKKAIEKYSESLLCSSLESATSSHRYLLSAQPLVLGT